jgi:hypothetical protein
LVTSKSAEPEAKREWPLTALFFAAMVVGLFAILANLLNFHNYPVWRAEIAVLLVVLLLIAAGATGLHRLAQPRLTYLFTGLFIALLIDFGTDLSAFVFPASLGVLVLLAKWWERIVLKLTLAAFASVLAFQSFDLAFASGQPRPLPNEAQRLQAKSRAGAKLPPIIHLMLDSYIGLDGMSAVDTNFGDLRQEQERFYLSRGFQIYPSAYSRHPKTINALPEFLSYGRGKHATEPRNVQFTIAPPLDYFIDLDRKGYRTSALTPSFVDLCPNQPLTLCQNYNRSDLSSLVNSDLSVADRARVIGFTILELSQFTSILSGTIDLEITKRIGARGRHLHNRAKLYSLTGFQQLAALSRDLSKLDYGEARFVHLLLPHDPHMMDANCKLRPEPDWIDEHGPEPLARRDAAYARQVHCMTEHGLQSLIAALDKTAPGRAAIVIIQGDHGSRTLDFLPVAGAPKPSQRELTVSHSTFFAIRVPGQEAVKVDGRFALDELIGGFAATGFTAPPRPVPGPAEVYLMDPYWIPTQRITLPPFIQKLPKN